MDFTVQKIKNKKNHAAYAEVAAAALRKAWEMASSMHRRDCGVPDLRSWQLKAWLKLDGATGQWSQGVVTVQLKSRLQPNWNVVVGA